MYRIFILSLLAIVFSTFALEPSQVILRATEIRGDSMLLEWSNIDGATSYKVLYDEESLINPQAPEPILESASTEKTSLEIQKMMEGTEYYLIVHGFDNAGTRVGETIPLHASTLRSPLFTLKESKVLDDQNISLFFSRPIDLENTQIEILNTETKKPRAAQKITTSPDDLRIVQIQLEGKMALNVSHDIVLKKVTDISGIEMLPEAKKTSTLVFVSLAEKTEVPVGINKEETPVIEEEVKEADVAVTEDLPIEQTSEPDAALDALKEKTEEMGIERVEASIPLELSDDEKTPVTIDQLPKTGMPAFILLGIALLLGGLLSYKKRTSF